MNVNPISVFSQITQQSRTARTNSKGSLEVSATEVSTAEVSATEEKALVRACQEMESLFLSQLLKEMRASIPESGMDGNGNGTARSLYTSMSDQHLANELAGKGGIGLASVLLDRLGR